MNEKHEPDTVRSSHQLERCDLHRDRPASHEVGEPWPRGDGSMSFRVAHRLCSECYAGWKKKNIAFEYIR